MKLFQNASIKHKLEAIILTTAATVLMVSVSLYIFIEVRSAKTNLIDQLEGIANLLSANSTAVLSFRDKEAALGMLSTLSIRKDIVSARIMDVDGRIFASYNAPDKRLSSFPEKGAEDKILPLSVFVSVPILLNDNRIGTFEVVGDLSAIRQSLYQKIWIALGIFILSMILAFIISNRLQLVISGPVKNLLESIKNISQKKNFSLRAKRMSNDELGNLVDAFNQMLDQIEKYDIEIGSFQKSLVKQVTERTLALEKAKLAAESANRAKSDFLAAMSHEIRTPMNGVVGFASLLQETELNAQQRDYVKVITQSGDKLLTIIDDILDFSKMEIDKLTLKTQDFVLKKLVDDVDTFFKPKASKKGLSFNVSIDPELPYLVHGDPVRISQVLFNLVGNAIKFTSHGSVEVAVNLIHQTEDELVLNFIVQDTGIGVAMDKLDLLFQPFSQADGSITRQFGGTGLGLVISDRLVKLMNGTINVSSMPGEGSSFSATIQLRQSEKPDSPFVVQPKLINAEVSETAENQKANAAESLKGLSVLVVDDDAINLALAEGLLSHKGITVISATGGDEALDMIEQQSIDLVLMDLEMPEMSGFETTRRLRKMAGKAKTVPIIALTAHAFPEKRREVMDVGMNDLLAKPYKPEQLYQMITLWTGKEEKNDTHISTSNFSLSVYDQQQAKKSTNGDKELENRLVENFIAMLPSFRESIQKAASNDNYEVLYDHVHKLAGSAGTCFAVALHASADALQKKLKLSTVPTEQIGGDVLQLLDEMERFEKHFKVD
jgi:signal transduction histidine kinase/DNA-binding response OmpR family regulator